MKTNLQKDLIYLIWKKNSSCILHNKYNVIDTTSFILMVFTQSNTDILFSCLSLYVFFLFIRTDTDEEIWKELLLNL